MSVLSMLDLGHQNYMAYEFLRIGQKDFLTLSKAMWSAVIIAVLVSIFQIVIVLGLISTDSLTFLLGESKGTEFELIRGAGIALIIQAVVWLIGTTVSGLITRALSPFGYFPRMAWWGVIYQIVAALAPLTAVVMGANIVIAAATLGCGLLVLAVFLYVDLFKILKKERIRFVKPSLPIGYSNFAKSLPLLGKAVLENVRQQGVRLILAPLSGAVGLAAFSTMRTGANVALQGLNTIVNPLLPDLMRFLHDRDQPRSEAAFATIWIVVVALMAPGVVLLQTFIEPFYVFWTQGKIAFNPFLFALLSLGVLVYAVVQPAMAVVIGNNLTKTQLALAGLSASIACGLLIVLVPDMGILGAGIALLIAEVVAGYGYKIYAKRWMNNNHLLWPRRSFYIAVLSVIIAAVSISAMVWLPDFKWPIVTISMALFAWNFLRYWRELPEVATQSAKNVVSRIPGVRRVVGRLS